MTIVKGRNTSIDVLRVLLILMILKLHSFRKDGEGLLSFNIWPFLDFYGEALCVGASDVFILISGYFGINLNFKKVFKLLSEFTFVFIAVILANCIFNICDVDYVEFFRTRPINKINYYWFLMHYFMLMFLSPILNIYLLSSNDKKLIISIFVLYFSNLLLGGPSIFIVLYMIGYIIRKNENLIVGSYRFLFLFFIIGLILGTGFYVFTLVINNNIDTYQLDSIYTAKVYKLGINLHNPLVIIKGVCLFLFFLSIKLNNRVRISHYIVSSVFVVYILHLHPLIKNSWKLYVNSLYNEPSILHICNLLILFLFVYIVSIILKYLFEKVFNYSYKKARSLYLWNLRK